MISELIQKLKKRETLTVSEAEKGLEALLSEETPEEDAIAFLCALRDKGEVASEIVGAVNVLRRRMIPLPITSRDAIDLCGTGGDGKNTFNISTAVAFVVAGAGVTVAKHGNRAVSSPSGSSDVLSALGVNIEARPEVVGKCVDEIGIGFLFAPLYHPALKKMAPIRKKIGTRTIFNILGPLLNPAAVKKQVVGVFRDDLREIVAKALKETGSQSVAVVHASDGLDELTMTGPSRITWLTGGSFKEETFDPRSVGYEYCSEEELKGGTADENAKRLKRVLKGHSLALDHCVHLNAALALRVAGVASDWRDAALMAQESISSGKAYRKLEELIEFTHANHPG